MYERIWHDYLSKLKDTREGRTLYVGQALRFIREEARKSRTALSAESKIGLPLLKAIETKREAYTTWENIVKLARGLNIPIEKLIQRSREEFPNNFFVQRKDGRVYLDYDGITAYPLSPPFSTQNDFLILKIHLAPQKSMNPCRHFQAKEIACYVMEGPLKFRFGNQTDEFKANQSFFFDGAVEHGFLNENPEKTVEFYLCLNPAPSGKPVPDKAPKRQEGLDLAFALEYARRKISPVPGIPLPWNMLAELTGLSLRALTHLKSGKTEIVYWDKLEALAQGTGIPLEEIVNVASGKTEGRFEICNALHRGYLDYGDQFGMRIYSAVRPGSARRRFFIGQVFLNKRLPLHSRRHRWRYKTNAFICAVVQDGRVLIEYGDRKKEIFTTGDSVYFDANLEFVVHNLEHQESKLFLFTQPPLF